MLKPIWVVALCAVSGILGFAQHWQYADGAGGGVPPACPQFQCANIDSYWDAIANDVYTYKITMTNVGTQQGVKDLFTPAANWQPPLGNTGKNLDEYTWQACVPKCGKDPLGVWQAPQEVTPQGVATKVPPPPVAQQTCTNAPNGGPIVNPPQNNNPNNNTPPGN